MSNSLLTSSSTVGPFFAPCLLREDAIRQVLAPAESGGEAIRIEGSVFDGNGERVTDAMIEIWQADPQGHYNHPADSHKSAFLGFGRAGTDSEGKYWFETVKPGPVPFDTERMQAPHVCVTVFARGLLNHLLTRLYFEDEPTNKSDPILVYVPADRQATLLARPEAGQGLKTYRFDIVLQGPGETAFFNL
jgi:protocatechuate 3,4-dioxygenase, alpha subunit